MIQALKMLARTGQSAFYFQIDYQLTNNSPVGNTKFLSLKDSKTSYNMNYTV